MGKDEKRGGGTFFSHFSGGNKKGGGGQLTFYSTFSEGGSSMLAAMLKCNWKNDEYQIIEFLLDNKYEPGIRKDHSTGINLTFQANNISKIQWRATHRIYINKSYKGFWYHHEML